MKIKCFHFASNTILKYSFARTVHVFILTALMGLLAAPAHAAVISLTLSETDFGSPSSFPTTDNGVVWTGTVDAGSYASTPSADFSIDAFQITIEDQVGNPLDFNDGTTNTSGSPNVRNDVLGNPEFMSSVPGSITGLDHSFSWDIPVFFGTPGTGYLLTFNSINAGVGLGGTNKGTWTMGFFDWDGFSIVGSVETFRFGTYDLSVSNVPVPAAAWLFGSGLLGLAGIARRKNTV